MCLLAYANVLHHHTGGRSDSNLMLQDITTTTELQGMSIAGTRPSLAWARNKDMTLPVSANLMLATTLTLLLFSAAGIPPLVGFFAKYQVISSALSSGYFYISLITILASLISSVYYLRVIRAIWALGQVNQPSTSGESGDLTSYSGTWSPRNYYYFTSQDQSTASLFSSYRTGQSSAAGPAESNYANLSAWFAFSLSLITGLVIIYCFQIPVIET